MKKGFARPALLLVFGLFAVFATAVLVAQGSGFFPQARSAQTSPLALKVSVSETSGKAKVVASWTGIAGATYRFGLFKVNGNIQEQNVVEQIKSSEPVVPLTKTSGTSFERSDLDLQNGNYLFFVTFSRSLGSFEKFLPKFPHIGTGWSATSNDGSFPDEARDYDNWQLNMPIGFDYFGFTWPVGQASLTPTPIPTITVTPTPTPTPNQTPQNLLQNSSFEQLVTSSNSQDLDPTDWVIAEGLMEVLPKGGESGRTKTEYPKMIQVVGSQDGITPKSGQFMLRNKTALNLKSHFRQYFTTPVTSGILVQKVSLYIPPQNSFIQQLEIRRATAGKNFQNRWTNSYTRYCIRTKEGILSLDYCKYSPPLQIGKWHDYEYTFTKNPTNSRFAVTVKLDGNVILSSGTNGVPFMSPLKGQMGFVFVGDECQGNPVFYDASKRQCDGLGTIFFDNVEALYYP